MKYLLILLFLCGCAAAPYRPMRSYAVDGFTLVLMEQADIRQQYKIMYGRDLPRIRGYCDQQGRVLFVAYGEGLMPIFETSGHEQWHLLELGGNFHP